MHLAPRIFSTTFTHFVHPLLSLTLGALFFTSFGTFFYTFLWPLIFDILAYFICFSLFFSSLFFFLGGGGGTVYTWYLVCSLISRHLIDAILPSIRLIDVACHSRNRNEGWRGLWIFGILMWGKQSENRWHCWWQWGQFVGIFTPFISYCQHLTFWYDQSV